MEWMRLFIVRSIRSDFHFAGMLLDTGNISGYHFCQIWCREWCCRGCPVGTDHHKILWCGINQVVINTKSNVAGLKKLFPGVVV